MGEGEPAGQRPDLLVLAKHTGSLESERRLQRDPFIRAEQLKLACDGLGYRRHDRIDDNPDECDTDAFLEGVRRFNGLVDRCFFGKRDQYDAGLLVRQQRPNFVSLTFDRARRHCVGQRVGPEKKRNRMATRGRVDDDHIGGVGMEVLLDPAEHEKVLDSRCRGGDHIDCAARSESLGQESKTVVVEIVKKSSVGSNGTAEYHASSGIDARGQCDRASGQSFTTEEVSKVVLAFHVEKENGLTGACTSLREGRRDRGLPDTTFAHDGHEATAEDADVVSAIVTHRIILAGVGAYLRPLRTLDRRCVDPASDSPATFGAQNGTRAGQLRWSFVPEQMRRHNHIVILVTLSSRQPFERFPRCRRPPSAWFRRAVRVLAFVLASVAFTSLVADSAAAIPVESPPRLVNVIEVSGFLDPAVRDFIVRSVDDAVRTKAQVLVIQLNSRGSLLSQKELDALESRLREETRVPIAVWVGGGAAPRAYGGAARIVAAADVVGLARLAKVGKSTPSADPNDPLLGPVMNFTEAKAAKVFTIDAPVLPEFVGQLDGKTINGRLLDTAKDAVEKDGRQIKELRGVRFAKMNVLERLFHIGSNQTVAYFLFVIALALFVFEFFTGGIGIAAGVGIGAFLLAVTGLGVLPTRPIGIALLFLAMFGFAIDIQAGTPRFWTGIGTISFVAGSVLLFANGIRVPWFAIGLVTVMVVLFMVNGMPTMVRTRFATPTIGRESMIGEIGVAAGAVNPDGVVTVLGAPWRARTNRATPISTGESVRVVGIDGLLLEVEPLEGAAKDAGH